MKYLTLITLALMATTAQADFWDNCTAYGGTIITANSYGNDKGGLCNDPNDSTKTNNCNGKRFCLRSGSPTTNWWSTFTWCEAIGGKLTSFESMCPGTQPINGHTCANVKGIYSRYKGSCSMGIDTTRTIAADLSSGTLTTWSGIGDRNSSYDRPALCEEK